MSPPPRVLVLSGGLIHLANQLAVVLERPELRGGAAEISVLLTGAITWDPLRLAEQHRAIERWLEQLRQLDSQRLASVQLIRKPETLEPGTFDLACLNNQWQQVQRDPCEQLEIPTWLICGDGLGLYYRCARELKAIPPSLLNLPIREPGRRVHTALVGAQPCWHRPHGPIDPVPLGTRARLFEALVASFSEACKPFVEDCLAATRPDRALWLCSLPNLAHQFPGTRLPPELLGAWIDQLPGFDPSLDRLLLIEHPKAPTAGSLGSEPPPGVVAVLRSAVPVEVLVRALERAAPGRRLVVAGLTSALYGVRSLSGAEVVWLGLRPLWTHNPRYRRHPLEFLHRLVRVRRMAWLTRRLVTPC
ncbi:MULTISPECIES: hypothetical protein [unclassified Synechococcus]|uniref:hypothetical protein n=1 Tax=unclassified Synechococcus TaxID=2626047 RepID=UPI000069866A|nr:MULTISPECIES: hypothetical protein [unclassified Synechococcus]EAQ75527.1 hypothetical protein WH5701_01725 [Synechococcus sp. WH 5701]MCP9824792.1 hypothetical protein [Synechococcus sp. EJ6-Ellesmere]WFN59780.1 hypothetical protein N4320_04060 [Synechococcus sp. CCFWC 502]